MMSGARLFVNSADEVGSGTSRLGGSLGSRRRLRLKSWAEIDLGYRLGMMVGIGGGGLERRCG